MLGAARKHLSGFEDLDRLEDAAGEVGVRLGDLAGGREVGRLEDDHAAAGMAGGVAERMLDAAERIAADPDARSER